MGVVMSKQERNEGKSGISDLTVIALVTSVLLPVVGWVVGFKARKQIVESDGKYTGRPFATAAIWIGGILTSAWLVMFAFMGFCASYNNDDDGIGWMNHTSMHRGYSDYAPLTQDGNLNRNGFGRGMMGQQQDPNTSTNP